MRKFSYIEIMLVVSFVFMLGGLLFSWSKSSALKEYSTQMNKTEAQLNKIINYKKSWDKKGIDKSVNRLKTLVSSNVKEYRVSRKKAYIKLSGLDVKVLSRFLVKLSALPVQYITLDIDSNGAKYSMECRCKW